MTSVSQYVWIYGLAEALAVSLFLTAVCGFNWWRLRQSHQQSEQMRKAIAAMIKDRISELDSASNTRPELQRIELESLQALLKPFRKQQFNNEEVWKAVLESLERSVREAMRVTHAPAEKLAQGITQIAESAIEDEDPDLFSASKLDTGIEDLLAQYQVGKSAIGTNQDATADMKHHYQQAQLANRELRRKLNLENNAELLQIFDTYERSNAAFMKTLSVKERSYNLLVKEYESLQEHIHNLQVTISNYRKSVHKLVGERSTLSEENKQLQEQISVTNQLIGRLNRNYDALRNEYTKLFDTTH